MAVPSESLTFCSVRSVKPPCSNSVIGYRSGILPNSSRRPAGHHPPQSTPCLSARSSAARSTPVCPPEIIFTCLATHLVAGRNNVRALDHQNHGSFRRACAMAHAFGHDEALAWQKINCAIFEIDYETSVQNEKEFINFFVFVPMILALNHGQPHDRIVHLAKRLVVPFVRAGIGEFLHIDQFKRSVKNIEVSFVRKLFSALSRVHAANVTADNTKVAEKNLAYVCSTFAPSSAVKIAITLRRRSNGFRCPARRLDLSLMIYLP